MSRDLRANQKERTRAAIIEAAGTILRQGEQPTVPAAADVARVSRATAYRYFPTQESLLVELVGLSPVTGPVEELLAGLSPEDKAEDRFLALLDKFNTVSVAHETSMRTALRLYQDTWLNRSSKDKNSEIRAGRRMRWIDQTLAPLRKKMSERAWNRLRYALSLTMGIDAWCIMKDVCHIESDAEAQDALRWAAEALLQAATSESRRRAN